MSCAKLKNWARCCLLNYDADDVDADTDAHSDEDADADADAHAAADADAAATKGANDFSVHNQSVTSVEADEKLHVKILFEQMFENKYTRDPSVSFSRSDSNSVRIQTCHPHVLSLMVEGLGTWQFDPLSMIVTPSIFAEIFLHVLEDSGLVSSLRLLRTNLSVFALAVAQLYHDSCNPYHNMRHAMHVFHNTHMLFKLAEVKYIVSKNPLIAFAAYIASFCHDLDHCGSTNRFLVATNHRKAIQYNGLSPQEMHHASVALGLIDKCKILESSKVIKNEIMFKEHVVKLILSTNIANHNTILQIFDKQKVSMCVKLIIKCADLSHTFAPLETHLKWTNMLQSEFFIQGDREKYHKFPVTAMFDREAPCTMANTQAQFFKMIAMPMFEILFDAFPSAADDIHAIHANIEHNYNYWQNYYDTHRVHRRSSVNMYLDNDLRTKRRQSQNNINLVNSQNISNIVNSQNSANLQKVKEDDECTRRTSNVSNISHATCTTCATCTTNMTNEPHCFT